MSRRLAVFLVLSLGWSALVGLGLFLTGVRLDSALGIGVVATLYMPAPLLAALVAERGFVRSRLSLPAPGWRPVATYVGLPVVVMVVFALVFLGAVLVGGDLLGLSAFGRLASTPAQIMESVAALVGRDAVDAAGPPPPLPLLLLGGIWGAAVAGWTVNGLFAMGEEYGWRGFLWDELEHLGVVKANLAIGTVWGLWHAPLILQGYNYPGRPLAGTAAMVVFCVGASFALTAIRRRTSSLVPVAAAHGMLNALAPLLLVLAPDADRVLTGPLGATGAVILGLVGALVWSRPRFRAQATAGRVGTSLGASGP